MRRFNKKERQRMVRLWKTTLLKLCRKRRRDKKRYRHALRRSRKVVLRKKTIHLTAPNVFDIWEEEPRRELVKFLGDLRGHYRQQQDCTLVIDFQNTSRFVASGTLLFYAEISRLIEFSSGHVKLRCTEPKKDKASQVLQQIGIYDLCNHPCDVKPTCHDVVHWCVVRGQSVNANIYAPAIEAHEKNFTKLLEGIFRGLGEAMPNAVEHAYIDKRKDGMNYPSGKSKWWVSSQTKDGFLSVALCDLGVGIPATLPLKRPGLFEDIKARIGVYPSDAQCIAAAVEDSRTRTNLKERGRGLGNIINVVANSSEGIAVVFSNRGRYVSTHKGESTLYNYQDSILGTIVTWRIRLTGETQPHGN